MLPTRARIALIIVNWEHLRRVMFEVTSKVVEVLAQFLALYITM